MFFFFLNLMGLTNKQRSTKNELKSQERSQRQLFQAFILEQILTPSASLVDVDGDGIPDSAHDLPDVDQPDIPDVDTLNADDSDADTEALGWIDGNDLDDTDPTFDSGVFTVGKMGKVGVDFLFDGGEFEGEVAIFSLEGMEELEPGSEEFIQEAASRALSDSELGHVVISDITEEARFDGKMPGEEDYNSGVYQGVNMVSMNPGDTFGVMLVPNGTVQEVFDNPMAEGDLRPLFSMATSNPDDAFHVGQIADITGEDNTFVMEDLRVDAGSDDDYNDVIFQVRGAKGTAVDLDDVIDSAHDWRDSDMGQALIDYAEPYVTPDTPNGTGVVVETSPVTPVQTDTASDSTTVVETPPVAQMPPDTASNSTAVVETPPVAQMPPDTSNSTVVVASPSEAEQFEFPPENQPLVGIIDTGVSADNPDLNYSNITLGTDYVAGDDNPLLEPGEGSEHGTHVLGIISATQDNDTGIDGINDDAPVWVSRAVGSGDWADALAEFVDAVRESDQPNAVVNLSMDLTQINPDGTVTTRYELTPEERSALEYARQHNVLIVVAAGNDGGVMSALGQASQEFDNIITVGSAENVDPSVAPAQGYERADYSSYGYGLDIMADGGTIENPVVSTTDDGMGTMAGTSVAAAQVTGPASLVWAANPDLSYEQVIEILESTATDLNAPGWDTETGAGLLNIAAAVNLAKATEPENYASPAIKIPDSWSGEGQVIPTERAAATEFMGKYYEWELYTIQQGDSLSQIALDRMGNRTEPYYNFIAEYNGIADPNIIIEGDTIYVPVEVSAPLPEPPTQPQPDPQPQPKPIVPIDPNSPNYRDGQVNPFAYRWQGQCTWYAYGRMLETGLLPAGAKANNWFLGNAESWQRDAINAGLPVTSTPTFGTRGLVVWPPGVQGGHKQYGHVAFLEEVYPDGSIRISESNWAGKEISERILTPAEYSGLVFVQLENATPNPVVSSPPAQPGEQRQYIVRPDDTLWEIAQRELGDGNRWTEITKADGSTFTEAEARNLQVGMSVYLPVTTQTGLDTPVTPPPSNTPTPISIEYGSYAPDVTQEFLDKVSDIAQQLGVPPEYLIAVMGFETGGAYSPSTTNPVSGATGLIQFMPTTAEGLGTSIAALAQMSAVQQLDYVAQYFQPYQGSLNSLEDVYMAVLWPAAVGKGFDYTLFAEGTIEYTQNAGLDINKDGVVTAGEATDKVRQYLPSAELFA